MLVLSRCPGEGERSVIDIDGPCSVTVALVQGRQVSLAFDADPSVKILRREIVSRRKKQHDQGIVCEWAILEIMGHQTYAGQVSEHAIGGASFVRIDVPEVEVERPTGEKQRLPPFTKLFGAGSIYCITVVSEEVARMRAASLLQQPFDVWDFPEEIREKLSRPALPAPSVDPDDDDGSIPY